MKCLKRLLYVIKEHFKYVRASFMYFYSDAKKCFSQKSIKIERNNSQGNIVYLY